jgi:hypothetical protein
MVCFVAMAKACFNSLLQTASVLLYNLCRKKPSKMALLHPSKVYGKMELCAIIKE